MLDPRVSDFEDSTDIAIIGMSGRFPGAETVDALWHNLCAGIESISQFSDEELLAAGVDPALLSDPNYVKAGAVLEDIELFDADFFGFTPREAQIIDPQHRLFLETAWNAIESAGYDPETYAGAIGLYAGAAMSTYFLNNLYFNTDLIETVGGLQVGLGNDKDSLATRVAYLLNLTGPCYTVQTYCSTSLVAVSIACSSLLSGECDMALAGGVNIAVPQKTGYAFLEGGIASPDARCRAFDAKANGAPVGSGVAVVVLKRLADAVADGDTIHAVIKGAAINNDGSLKVGYTAPGVRGQAGVIAEALANADVEAESISYIEAHGTGTALGDAVEFAALTKAFRESTDRKGFCAIGSVKTNVGHLDRAAGVTGLIKTALSLKHKLLPPSLNFEEPNPQLNIHDSPFYVNTKLTDWKTNGYPRRAGVSAFGLGGTNAHVIVEEAPELELTTPSRSQQLLLLSTRTETALEAATHNLLDYLQQYPDSDLADVAYTLQVGRKTFDHRRMLVCSSVAEARQILESGDTTRMLTSAQYMPQRPVVFMFPGVGDHYEGMAQELYETEPVFRQAVDHCCTLLRPHLTSDLRKVLYPNQTPATEPGKAGPSGIDLRALLGRGGSSSSNTTSPLHQTAVAQPAVFVIEYALAQLLIAWGIRPHALIGYSLGEYVAACVAGVLSLDDALQLVAARAQLIQALPAGAMLAVSLTEEAIQPFLTDDLSLAAVNGPLMTVVAGPPAAVAALAEQLTARGIACRSLETTHAFHSTMMEPLRETVTTLAEAVRLHPPQIPYLSNVTGTWLTAEQATDPAYWARHLCQTVRFAAGVETLLHESDALLLEVGPGQTLSSLVKQHPACTTERLPLVVPSVRPSYDRHGDLAYLLTALGKLWLTGVEIDWTKLYSQEYRHRLPLPTYPFEHQRYWLEPRTRRAKRSQAGHIDPQAAVGELKKEELADWFYLPGWKRAAPHLPTAEHLHTDQGRCWILFEDECGIGHQVGEWLIQRQQDVIVVRPGQAFTKRSAGSYLIDPGARQQYTALLRDLRDQGKTPTNILHLWAVTPPTSTPLHEGMLSTALNAGFYSLLYLTQTLAEFGLDACQIAMVSNDMQNVTGSEQICPEKAVILGPCKVIPLEYPNMNCRTIDITLPEPGTWQRDVLMEHLLGELTANPAEKVVALRGNHRWVQTFDRMHLAALPETTTRLRQGGTYLVTGGLGGIGLSMAEYLARAVQAKLVLIGRSGLPPRDTWPLILEQQKSTDAKGSYYQIQQIQMIESLGAEVLVVQADVTNRSQMQAAVQQALARFGTIHGVIHAAGVPGIGLIPLKTAEMAAQVLAPKVMGTLVLEEVLRNIPLDFMALFSSITSATGGGPGQIDYCAANAFLDAYAHRNFTKHGMTVAINWGEWQWNAWESGLAGYDDALQTFFREHRRRFGIAFAEGTEAFHRVLARRLPQVVVSTQDFQVIVELSNAFTTAHILGKNRHGQQTRAAHARPALGTSYVAPATEAERKIAAVWGEILGIADVGSHDNFFELGGNSLIGIDVIARMRVELNIDSIPAHALYEAPTVSAMAKFLDQGQTQTAMVEERHDRGSKRRERQAQRKRV
jgi:acyl transferase domain-containing protein